MCGAVGYVCWGWGSAGSCICDTKILLGKQGGAVGYMCVGGGGERRAGS